jgi:hypothetical protein
MRDEYTWNADVLCSPLAIEIRILLGLFDFPGHLTRRPQYCENCAKHTAEGSQQFTEICGISFNHSVYISSRGINLDRDIGTLRRTRCRSKSGHFTFMTHLHFTCPISRASRCPLPIAGWQTPRQILEPHFLQLCPILTNGCF